MTTGHGHFGWTSHSGDAVELFTANCKILLNCVLVFSWPTSYFDQICGENQWL